MVIVILIMTLLSLIVISMTKNANREQKNALDRQLNSQAFYAAESGINDAKDYYTKHANDPIAANRAPDNKSRCGNLETGALAGDQFPNHSSTVGANINSYSCVLYDATPDSLIFSDVGVSTSVLMPLEDDSGNPIESLTFTWKASNNTNYDFSNCNNLFSSGFPTALTGCDAGLLRIELIDPTATTRADLIDKNFVAFVAPRLRGPTTEYYSDGVTGSAKQGVSWKGGCNNGAAGECVIKIDNIYRNKLMLHLRSIYNISEVQVTGTNSLRNTISFKGGQMMIDSTGKASDILKRIRVRVPLNQYGNGVYPEFSLQTANGVCKLLQIIPQSTGILSEDQC